MSELIDRLIELAEWADANEWEVPIDLGDTIMEAVERLKRMQWVPVVERMPELDPDDPESFRKCLITVPLTMERTGKSHWEVHTAYAKWHKNKRRKKPFVWFDALPAPAIRTHWMPLPEPPEEVGDGE